MTSRHGQQYQCNYPTHQEQKQQKEEEEKIALEMGVVELLKPMAQEPCLLKVSVLTSLCCFKTDNCRAEVSDPGTLSLKGQCTDIITLFQDR